MVRAISRQHKWPSSCSPVTSLIYMKSPKIDVYNCQKANIFFFPFNSMFSLSLVHQFITFRCKLLKCRNKSDVRLLLAYGIVHGCLFAKVSVMIRNNMRTIEINMGEHLQWKISILRRIVFLSISSYDG